MDNIFKEGDRVYSHIYGWGTIMDIDVNVGVKFESLGSLRYYNGEFLKFLSFTEYTLEGFSQERLEELPKKGQIVWTRNEYPSEWEIGYFFKKEGNTYYTSSSKNSQGWRSAGLEIKITNPYENEQ
jgi:hypothetical protein